MPPIDSPAAAPPLDYGALFHSLLDSLQSCVAVVDAAGIIRITNETWANHARNNPLIRGLGAGDDYLRTCETIIQGKDGNFTLVAMGLISVIRGTIPHLRFEYPCIHEGETYWYGMSAKHALRAGSLGAVIQHADITEKMRVERKLRKNDQLFRATTENALDLIAILDMEGLQTYNNPSFQTILGYTSHELASQPFLALVHEDDQFFFSRSLETAREDGLSQIFEYRIRHHDGQWRYMEAKASMVDTPTGKSDSVLLVSREITQRKEMEVERSRLEVELRHAQRLEAIGQLSAGIAHEINTPIQFVGDNMHFLTDAFASFGRVLQAQRDFLASLPPGTDPGQVGPALDALWQQEDVDYLLEEVPSALRQSTDGLERVTTIVKAMKAFGHPGTEGRVSVDLNQAITSTLIVARNEWKYVAEVETDLAPQLPQVVCSPSEFNQVILNLLVNAAHAIGEVVKEQAGAKGTIRITTRPAGEWVQITLSDTGGGIPEAIRSQVFLPFFTTKPVGKGTGQGLSIAHSVIAKHGGEISFTSEVGQGTTFTIRLPLHPPKE